MTCYNIEMAYIPILKSSINLFVFPSMYLCIYIRELVNIAIGIHQKENSFIIVSIIQEYEKHFNYESIVYKNNFIFILYTSKQKL